MLLLLLLLLLLLPAAQTRALAPSTPSHMCARTGLTDAADSHTTDSDEDADNDAAHSPAPVTGAGAAVPEDGESTMEKQQAAAKAAVVATLATATVAPRQLITLQQEQCGRRIMAESPTAANPAVSQHVLALAAEIVVDALSDEARAAEHELEVAPAGGDGGGDALPRESGAEADIDDNDASSSSPGSDSEHARVEPLESTAHSAAAAADDAAAAATTATEGIDSDRSKRELLLFIRDVSDHVLRKGSLFNPLFPGSLASEWQPDTNRYKCPFALLWLYDEKSTQLRNDNQELPVWQKQLPLLPVWTFGVLGEGDCLPESAIIADCKQTVSADVPKFTGCTEIWKAVLSLQRDPVLGFPADKQDVKRTKGLVDYRARCVTIQAQRKRFTQKAMYAEGSCAPTLCIISILVSCSVCSARATISCSR